MSSPATPKPWPARYGVALLASGAAVLIALSLHSILDLGLMSILTAGVLVSAWYGGLGPGLFATGLNVLACDYFFIHPAYSFGIHRADDLAQLFVFSMVATLVSLLDAAQKRAQAALLESRERLRLMIEGALDAIVSVDAGGLVVEWNPQAEATFGWSRAEALGRPITGMLPALPRGESARVETVGLRREGAEFPIEISTVPVRSGGGLTLNYFLRDITERRRAEQELRRLHQLLEARFHERGDWLRLLYDITRTANEADTVDRAFRFAVRRICEDGFWKEGKVSLPDPENPARWEPGSLAARVADRGTALCEDAPDGGCRIAFPVTVGRETAAVVECSADRPLEAREPQEALMTAVGSELGRVIERRRLQDDYAEAVWQQQRRIAHDLHDSLGQELTGLGYMAKSLSESLEGRDEARLASKVSDGLGRSLQQIRDLVRGVLPVDLDAEGLMAALPQLARGVESVYGISCRVVCPRPVLVEDSRVALHLYRIAQEAVTNAVRHGRPKRVEIALESEGGRTRLRIQDDGLGIERAGSDGSGLRIMRYRAAAMGAALTIEKAPEGGTRVLCDLAAPEAPVESPKESKVH